MAVFDQFSQWLCAKCDAPGIDSWNKAIYDGIDHEDDDNPPLPHIIGMDCWHCNWAVTVRYDAPHEPPVAIYSPVGPHVINGKQYAYEPDAMGVIESDRAAGIVLTDAGPTCRDVDWRGGCTALVQPPPLS